MADWTPPAEPVTWDLAKPIAFGTATFTQVTLRAPTAGDILKATAVRGESGMSITLRLIAAISAEQVPYEALLQAPSWLIGQMSGYFESFNGAPPPGPLRPAVDTSGDSARPGA